MKSTVKLTSEERRTAIIKAVRRVFAEKGFHGTTTRALAAAAGVSEALLFKHFPNKEALFSAMQLSCCNGQDHARIERLQNLEPSASTLVLMVHFIVSRSVGGCGLPDEEQAIQNRLMLRSFAEDGEFARSMVQRLATCWIPKVAECVKAAVAAGDAYKLPGKAELRGWFASHLTAMIMFNLLPETPVIEYGVSRDKLIEHATGFILRGMGLREEALQRHYNPQALALFER